MLNWPSAWKKPLHLDRIWKVEKPDYWNKMNKTQNATGGNVWDDIELVHPLKTEHKKIYMVWKHIELLHTTDTLLISALKKKSLTNLQLLVPGVDM